MRDDIHADHGCPVSVRGAQAVAGRVAADHVGGRIDSAVVGRERRQERQGKVGGTQDPPIACEGLRVSDSVIGRLDEEVRGRIAGPVHRGRASVQLGRGGQGHAVGEGLEVGLRGRHPADVEG